MFDRVIAAIDGTRAGFEAGRQAARLTRPDGELVLVAVADPYLAMFNRWGPRALVDAHQPDVERMFALASQRLEERAGDSLRAMRAQLGDVPPVRVEIAHGRSWDVLREMAQAEPAALVALGSHGSPRLIGVACGSTTTEMLHESPCSVLVARPAIDPARFPASVVVGVDGSDGSLAALDVARGLHGAGGGDVRVLVAGGAEASRGGLERLAAPLPVEVTDRRPVEALVEAGHTCDLVVVGARGVTGVRALGSVSERVAHRAECSVLVVRPGA